MPNDRPSDQKTPLDFDALAVLYLDGQLEGEQHADFSRQLVSDPDKAARLASVAELHAGLIELGRTNATKVQTSSTGASSAPSLRRNQRLWARSLPRWGLAAAALVAVGLSIALLAPWSSDTQDLLTVDQGLVILERQGLRSRVRSTLALLPGDQIVLAGAAAAHIGSRRGDHLALAGGSRLSWSPTTTVRLDAGTLVADITPRPTGQPFLLSTPRADLQVIGTRFTVQAEESLSLLAVDHGRVRLVNRDDPRQVEVAANQLVVTAGAGELVATTGSLSVPTDTSGLTGDYFDHHDFTAWRLRRIDPTIDFNWDKKGPDERLAYERYSVRWRGYLVPAHSGTYTFTFLMDDGVRLWLDGRLVLDEWHLSEKLEFSTTVTLTAQQVYTVRLDYFQGPRGGLISWRWSLPGYAKQPIPTSWLRPLEWTPPPR